MIIQTHLKSFLILKSPDDVHQQQQLLLMTGLFLLNCSARTMVLVTDMYPGITNRPVSVGCTDIPRVLVLGRSLRFQPCGAHITDRDHRPRVLQYSEGCLDGGCGQAGDPGHLESVALAVDAFP